jgi:hypothetical protein
MLYILVLILAIGSVGDPSASSRAQIPSLLARLEQRPPGSTNYTLLPPTLPTHERARLARGLESYKLIEVSGYDLSRDLSIVGQHARLSAVVHWKTPHRDYEARQFIDFTEVDGTWYFSNLDFLGTVNWAEPLEAALIGICFACAAFYVYKRLNRTGTCIPSHR